MSTIKTTQERPLCYVFKIYFTSVLFATIKHKYTMHTHVYALTHTPTAHAHTNTQTHTQRGGRKGGNRNL